jgi:hypothetical protein
VEKMKTKQFRIDEEEWKKFKKITHDFGSNASVEIRGFIKEYNKRNSHEEIFNEIYEDQKVVLDALAK